MIKQQNHKRKQEEEITTREFNIVMSGQFCTLAMFFLIDTH